MSDPLAVTPVATDYPIVITVCLSLFGITVLTWCLAVRTKSIESWRTLSYPRWLILFLYIDSYLFVASTTILQVGVGLSANFAACEAVDFMCILFYCSSKVFTPNCGIDKQVIIYLFLIERVHIVRGGTKTRFQDKLYLFNISGLIPYVVIVILAIIFRYNGLDQNGHCYIGLQRIYLTAQFLLPMLGLYSYRIAQNPRLRQVARRTLVGTVATLTSSIANISAVFALQGHEPAFICLICCTADVAFSAVVLHWVTNVHNDEVPGMTPKVCLFHARGSTNCCIWRTWACTRTVADGGGSQSHRSAYLSNPIAFDDVKPIPGVDMPSTVTTEITSSGGVSQGASPKARKLLGWWRRASIEEPRRMSGIEEDYVGMGPNVQPRVSHSVDTQNTGITVQYDVRRTVEELRRESSSQEGDCITCIDISDDNHHRKGDSS